MFVHCAEDTDIISSAYDSSMSLPDRVKIWLTSVNSKFRPKMNNPLMIWASETFDGKLWPNG